MNIVVLDSHPLDAGDLDWRELESLGDVQRHRQTSAQETAGCVREAEVVLTNKVKLPREVFEAAPNLKLVSVLATGYDVIDVAAARERGVTVCNVPSYSSSFTAQTAIALLLELCHHAGEHSRLVHQGEWVREGVWSFWRHPLQDLNGKTLLIIGLGTIGRRVARIAQALGMTVLAANLPGREAQQDEEFARVALEDGLRQADVVSLHCPLKPETEGLMNAARLAQMKPHALLVNTGRGPLIEEEAVARALREEKLGGFAGDVLTVEPPAPDHPLFGAPNCILTPHLAWASVECRGRLLDVSVQNLRAFLNGAPQNVVR